jgi:CBS domain-containing protein
MTTDHADTRRCIVHGSRSEAAVTLVTDETIPTPRLRTISDDVGIGEVMSRELICVRPDLEVAEVVRLMVQHHVGCLPVVDGRRHPVGMITKFDIVENLDAVMQSKGQGSPLPSDLSPRHADDLMMPIALVLDEHATVAHAAAMMALEDTHHVMVVRAGGELLGVVSSKDIVKWLVANDSLATRVRE